MNSQGGGRWGWRTVWEFGVDICQCLTLDTMQVMSNSLQPAWTAACQASLSLTISQSLPKFMSTESVMPSSHLIFCHPLLLLPSIFPIIRVFFQWPSCSYQVAKALELQLQHQSFHDYSGLISFKTDWLELLAVQGTLKSLLQHQSSKASVFWHSAVFMVLLSQLYMTTGMTTALTIHMSVKWCLCFSTHCLGLHNFPAKKKLSSDFIAAVTIHSDFRAQEEEICYCFHIFPSICHEVMGPDAMILDFLILSFKSAFSISYFTLITRFCH